jgi:hypothetical protein
MISMPALFQNKLLNFMTQFQWCVLEANNLTMLYWKSDMQTKLATIADADPATVNSRMTKANIISSLTMFEKFVAMANSGTAVTADYAATAVNCLSGTVGRETVLSNATETYGDRTFALLTQLLGMANDAAEILSLYFAYKFISVLGVLEDEDRLLGATATKSEISSAVTVIEQFKKMAFGESYTTGNYHSISYRWQGYSALQATC